ncbi:MAG: phosphoribosylamine--glycine ligase [Paracoccaceae bacterium]
MNILILGGGGREHALAWACKRSPRCDRVICAPGNPGIAQVAEIASLDILDGAGVAEFAARQSVDLVIVGPEAPLVAGVADALAAAGIPCFGPSAAAARLEASKAFTKAICAEAGAPTAAHAHFTDIDAARDHVRAHGAPTVVKADGLAAGKGVTVAATMQEALSALDALDGPGAEVVIEDVLTGEEASLFILAHGTQALVLGGAQDHKRIGEGDTGPNTGGMGAYAPAPVLTDAVTTRAMDRIVRPVLAAMAARGTPYCGVLYAGLMIDAGEPSLVEFNVRFGDPEAQVLAMRLGAQLLDLIQATAEARLDEAVVSYADDHAMTVVMAAPGYPGTPRTGQPIGLPDPSDPDTALFHAGTAERDGALVSAGGRVLCATARGASLAEARDRAYALVDAVDWPDAQVRRDIGHRALG